jgi:hypothetical protein
LLFLTSATSSLFATTEIQTSWDRWDQTTDGHGNGHKSVQIGVWADIPLGLLDLLLLILHFTQLSQMLVDRLPMPALALCNESGRRSRLHHCFAWTTGSSLRLTTTADDSDGGFTVLPIQCHACKYRVSGDSGTINRRCVTRTMDLCLQFLLFVRFGFLVSVLAPIWPRPDYTAQS